MATTQPKSNHTQEQQLAHSQNQTFAQLALQSQLSQLNPKNKRKSWMDKSVDRVGELKKKKSSYTATGNCYIEHKDDNFIAISVTNYFFLLPLFRQFAFNSVSYCNLTIDVHHV